MLSQQLQEVIKEKNLIIIISALKSAKRRSENIQISNIYKKAIYSINYIK